GFAAAALPLGRLAALEERADVDAENRGDLIKPAAAHPVGAVLVFLHLLEAHPELVAQIGLRHLSAQPMDADVAANDLVDLLRPLLQHELSPRSRPRRAPAAARASIHGH